MFDDFTKRMALAKMNANLFHSNSGTLLSEASERRTSNTPYHMKLPPKSPYSKGGAVSANLPQRYTLSRFSLLHEKEIERNKLTPSATLQSGQFSFQSIKSEELETSVTKKKKYKKIIN